MKINLSVADETAELETVILGIATSIGKERGINPKAADAIKHGTYPAEPELREELNGFEQALVQNGISVFKPTNIENLNQIFVRDIGFVVDDHFVVARMKEEIRRSEVEALQPVLSMIDTSKIIYPPEGVYIEGGDVMLLRDILFVGVGKRTNQMAVDFLRDIFPNKQIISLKLKHDSDNPRLSVLHLDCAFQPVGKQWAILYEDGFLSSPGVIADIFGKDNLVPVASDEMYQMFPNILSISPTKIITSKSFTRLNNLLSERNIEVINISYDQVSILGGLLRCSTLPLKRKSN